MMPITLAAEGFRVATFHAELTRKGPGLLLRDIERGKDPQLQALASINDAVQPDILLLTQVDFDAELRTAHALQGYLGYAHSFALPPNSMVPTALDLNRDGRLGDRQTWARYAGEGAMLLLSQQPIKLQFHLNDLLWRDVQSAVLPVYENGDAFLSPEVAEVQKLVGQGFWVVNVAGQDGAITLVLFQNQAPLFDGSEGLSCCRNRGQLSLLTQVMDGEFGTFPDKRFVLMGNANLDPKRGQGDRDSIAALLRDPRVKDPDPISAQGGDVTAIWEKAGAMRVSYILPSHDWQVLRSKVVWPISGPLREATEQASRHRMIWMDIKQSP